ncbi:MAG: carboxypeptidase-like regulatory domain-containing protein [Kofleriaceae bacterium]
MSQTPARERKVAREAIARCSAPDVEQVPDGASLYGALCDSHGNWIAGATVIVESPALTHRIEALTNETGVWWTGALPQGTYLVAYYWADVVDEIDVTVFDHPSQVLHEMGTSPAGQ